HVAVIEQIFKNMITANTACAVGLICGNGMVLWIPILQNPRKCPNLFGHNITAGSAGNLIAPSFF
ncbi:MAG TPA: hypothetical protein DER68_01575, partial [Ruminococcaceae bacterium]|nr:hypothetical protein [Oscillospiraceae bacterium]